MLPEDGMTHFALTLFFVLAQQTQPGLAESSGRWLATRLAKTSAARAEGLWRWAVLLATGLAFLFRLVLATVALANVVRLLEQHFVSSVRAAAAGASRPVTSQLQDIAAEMGLDGVDVMSHLRSMEATGKLPAAISTSFHALKLLDTFGNNLRIPALPSLPWLDWLCRLDACAMHLFLMLFTVLCLLPANALLRASERRLAEAEVGERREAKVALQAARARAKGARAELAQCAWGALEPRGSHARRLSSAPLAANGVLIGSNAAALSAFAEPLGMVPLVVADRLVHEVHCAVAREDETGDETGHTVVEGIGGAQVWRNGVCVQGREKLAIGDDLRLGSCISPFVDITYRLGEACNGLQAEVDPSEDRCTELVKFTMKWITCRRQSIVRKHWCAYHCLSIVLLCLGLVLGLVALTQHLEVDTTEYLSIFFARRRRSKSFKRWVTRTGVLISEQLISPWSVFYLICVCIAVPAVMVLAGFLAVLLWGAKEARQKTEALWVEVAAAIERVAGDDAKELAKVEEELRCIRPCLQPGRPRLPPSVDASCVSAGLVPKAAAEPPLPGADDLRCPICLGVCVDCVALLPCGHNLCAGCCGEHLARLKVARCPYTCQVDRVVPNALARARVLQRDFLAGLSADEILEEERPLPSLLQLPPEGRPAVELCRRALRRRRRAEA